MGVHGLWDLLSPVGRRVSVETLAGKRLAIDASIWLIQFMKAMRDEKGEMVRNAHLIGFFRRICKLLYLRTKPVFVFDGGTPALKRRTVIARRRQRENAHAKIRKTAEKLFLNQLKQIRLKELADELENQRRSNIAKGKKIATEEGDVVKNMSAGTSSFTDRCNQEAVNEMLAASLAAEEQEGFTAAESSSGPQIEDQDEDGDEDEEMILPTIEGKIDPAILAALPPSMQLDLLVQMRERLMAENRKKYQRVKKVPASFSELQIQAYLKTVAFRREIDEVQKSAAGRGLGGVKTSRIASEANREFIFSSNYDGDKSVLTSTDLGRKENDQSREPLANPSGSAGNNVASLEKCSAVGGFTVEEPQKDLENDVETYLDERGRVRVSRVRAMGIRMTRDIQRNLDLMKEIEEEQVAKTKNLRNEFTGCGAAQGNTGEINIPEASNKDTCDMTFKKDKVEETMLEAGTSIKISFDDNGQHEFGCEDDDLFTQLVAGEPVMDFSIDNSLSKMQSLDSSSELEWEEGGALTNDVEPERKALQVDGMSMEQELEWEEGSLEIHEEDSSFPAEYKKDVSKGVLEEEADLQEAIRRSIQDLADWRSIDKPDKDEKTRNVEGVVSCGSSQKGDQSDAEAPSRLSGIQHNDSLCEFQENTKCVDVLAKRKLTETKNHLEIHVTTQLEGNCGKVELLPVESQSDPSLQDVNQDGGEKVSLEQKVCGFGTCVQQNGTCQMQLRYASGSDDMVASDGFLATVDGHPKWTAETEKISEKNSVQDICITQEPAEKEARECFLKEGDESLDKSASSDYGKADPDVAGASLEEEMLILGEEYKELGDKQRKLERNAESVNNEMFAECQELLQMFGLPYIIAPMEAEAQCAYMETVNLVDGVVTDDSDVFLFGARNVYKNIFDDRKYVETYFMKDIENELGLNREKLIHMALLLGSDYTEGVSGIGIVNAIEVVNAFPEEDGLRKFREWIESPDPSILGKFDVQPGGCSKKIEPQVGDAKSLANSKLSKVSASDGHVSGSVEEAQLIKQNFMDKHRNVSKNWHIPPSFPSEAVISEYNSPQVDKSTEPFSWGKPDHYVLRKLCWEKLGWNMQKADELLLPVLREYEKRETQLRLEAFYTFNERFAKIQSKRIKKAVKGITKNQSSDLMDESVQDGSRKKRKRRTNQSDEAGAHPEKAVEGKKYTNGSNETSTAEKLSGKKSRKTIAQEAKVKGRVGGECTGAGKDSSTKRSRKKTNPSPKYAVSCSDDEICNEGEKDSQVSSREPSQVRRSRRSRKEVNYAMSDPELDLPNEDGGNPMNENAAGEERFPDAPEEAGYSSDVPSKKLGMEPMDPAACGSSLDETKLDKVTDEGGACLAPDTLPEMKLSSEDYLTMGGGFCMEEEGTDQQSMQGSSSCSTRGGVYDPDPPNCSDLGNDENTATPVRRMNSGEDPPSHSVQNVGEYVPGKEPLKSLRAIPNLKKKRSNY